jgi:hypothetical protein
MRPESAAEVLDRIRRQAIKAMSGYLHELKGCGQLDHRSCSHVKLAAELIVVLERAGIKFTRDLEPRA